MKTPSSPPATYKLVGIAASPGVIVGRAMVVDRRRLNIPRKHIGTDEVMHELQRFQQALATARTQLAGIRARLPVDAGDHALILDAHLLILEDQALVDQTRHNIERQCMNAEWALRETIDRVKDIFSQADDGYFRERQSDIDFVGERILRCLLGEPGEIPRPREAEGPVILVAHELSPADTAALNRSDVKGFVTDGGTSTSHTAIMARALSIPAVVGVADATRFIATGDMLVLDGLRGQITISPDSTQVEAAQERGRQYSAFVTALEDNRDRPSETRDGVRVALRANIELPSEAAVAVEHGADGIGLYRTEFLYIDRRDPPSEDEQFEVYKAIVETTSPRIVTLRTFDIGGDKFSSAFRMPKEMNPALGLRAVRLALRNRDVFRTQLRAMLRAACFGSVRIMVPMISTLDELRESRHEMDLARVELRARNIETPEVPLGVMVETPSAVWIADHLARSSAFFSIGTNDLLQYSLAIDRGNEHVAHLARPFDPSILRSIARIADTARSQGIPCALCGAMAGSILAVPALIGLGVSELSVEPSAIAGIKEAVSRIHTAEARAIMDRALTLSTADEVETLLREVYAQRLHDLLNAGG